MSIRKGYGKGKGKGYTNLMGNDSKIHSQSARGVKQPQRLGAIQKIAITEKFNLKDLNKDGIGDILEFQSFDPKKFDRILEIKKASTKNVNGYIFPKRVEKIECPICKGNGIITEDKILSMGNSFGCKLCNKGGVVSPSRYALYLDDIVRTNNKIQIQDYHGAFIENKDTFDIQDKAWDNVMKKGVFAIDSKNIFFPEDKDFLKPTPKSLQNLKLPEAQKE